MDLDSSARRRAGKPNPFDEASPSEFGIPSRSQVSRNSEIETASTPTPQASLTPKAAETPRTPFSQDDERENSNGPPQHDDTPISYDNEGNPRSYLANFTPDPSTSVGNVQTSPETTTSKTAPQNSKLAVDSTRKINSSEKSRQSLAKTQPGSVTTHKAPESLNENTNSALNSVAPSMLPVAGLPVMSQSAREPSKDAVDKGLNVPIVPPVKEDSAEMAALPKVDLSKYDNLGLEDLQVDVRPRIRNIIEELYSEHDWSWPPAPAKDVRKMRFFKRKKNKIFYNQEFYDFATFLSIIIGPLELFVAVAFALMPKTFILAMRECVEIIALVIAVFTIQGIYHSYAGILGLALRASKPFEIGYVYPHWPFQVALPLLGIFCVFACMYMTQDWMVEKEMTTHLKGYNFHWYSKSMWDYYQKFMCCCGIEAYSDWEFHGPLMYDEKDGRIFSVPESCCVEPNCSVSPTKENVWGDGCLDRTVFIFWVIYVVGAVCVVVSIVLMCIGHRSVEEAARYGGDPIHKLLFDDRWSKKRLYNRSSRREELLRLLNHYCIILGRELGFHDEVSAAEAEEKERNSKNASGLGDDPFMGGDTFTGNSPPTPSSLDHFLDDMYLPLKKEQAPAPAQDSKPRNKPVEHEKPEMPPSDPPTPPVESASIKFESLDPIALKNVETCADIAAGETSSPEFHTPICAESMAQLLDETTMAVAQELTDSFAGTSEENLAILSANFESDEIEQRRMRLLETELSNMMAPARQSFPLSKTTFLTAEAQENSAVIEIENIHERNENLNVEKNVAGLKVEAAHAQDSARDNPSLFSLAERNANLAAFKEIMDTLTPDEINSEAELAGRTRSEGKLESTKDPQTSAQNDKRGSAQVSKLRQPSAIGKKGKGIPVLAKVKKLEQRAESLERNLKPPSRLPTRSRPTK